MFLLPSISSESFGYNYLVPGENLNPDVNLSKITVNHSNTTDNWLTNIGALENVNSTQFENNAGTLSIIWSWLIGELDNDYLRLDASNDPITGDLDINAGLDVQDNFSVDTNTLFVDSSKERVGIGINSPDTKLHVKDGDSGANPFTNTLVTFEDDQNWYFSLLKPAGAETGFLFAEPASGLKGGIIFDNTLTPNGFQFRIDNSNKMVIDSNGNVGIGTTSPSEQLTIAGNMNLQNDSDKLFFGQAKDVSINFNGTQTQFTNEVGSGDWVFPTGNIGIGTTSPGQNIVGSFDYPAGVTILHLDNTQPRMIIRGSTDAGIDLIDTSSGTDKKWMQLYNNAEITYFRSLNDAGGIKSNNILVMKQDDGKVGIGTATPTTKLQVNGTITSKGLNVTENVSFSSNFTVGNTALFVNANDNRVCVNCSTIIGNQALEVDGNANITGNLTVGTINITRPDSLNIILPTDIATFSAAGFSVFGKTRTFVQLNNDLFIQKDSNQTIGLGVSNFNTDKIASTSFTMGLFNNTALALHKKSINYTNPYQAFLANERGFLDIINTKDSIRLGFFDDFELLFDLSFGDPINERIMMEIWENNITMNVSLLEVDGNANITGNLTLGQKITFSLGEMIDNIVDGWIKITGNLNVTGNLTGNFYYGEMWFHMLGNSTISITTKNVWENVTGFNNDDNNGFTRNSNTLTCNLAGKYKVDYSASYDNGANTEFNFAIAINNVVQNKTTAHSKLTTAASIGNINGQGFIDLSVGDNINLQVVNRDNVQDISFHHTTVNLVRIGD
jgi:hypothetical protein